MLLALQFGTDVSAQPILHYAEKVWHPYRHVDIVLITFRDRTICPARRDGTKGGLDRHGDMADHLWPCFVPKTSLAYKKAVTILNNSFSDDIGTYIHWMSVFTYWAIIFGVGCGALTFLPDKYIFIWILSSVPFYIYLYICYQNYLLFYEQVENAMENEMPSENEVLYTPEQEDGNTHELPGNSTEIIGKRINAWINMDKYVHPGLTITELSKELHTNRTYLSTYINTEYNMSFRNWITELRMEYAKRKIIQYPEKTIVEIAGISGFLSMSHFIKTFKEKEGCSPSTWKKTNQGNKKKADHETC